MPQEEIARQLGIGRNALYKLGHDARKRLKARLIAAGVTDEDVRAAFDLYNLSSTWWGTPRDFAGR